MIREHRCNEAAPVQETSCGTSEGHFRRRFLTNAANTLRYPQSA
jgi:hypothetical protein